MRKTDTARLDVHALLRHLETSGLKQWWIAHQVGVDPKTVGRWVSGKVQRIGRENLVPLAEVLGCAPEELVLRDEADAVATRQEQRTAARLLRERDLLQKLSPGDEWELVESLVRATMEPNLPLVDLGHLYNLLSIAAWRQGSYDEGRAHALRAEAIAQRIGEPAIGHKASHNLATIASLTGDQEEARRRFERCLASPEVFERRRDLGATLSNLGNVYRTLLRFGDSERVQRGAISVFAELELPFNLAIAELSLSQLLAEWGRHGEAEAAAQASMRWAERAGYTRGALQAWFYVADARSLAGDPDAADLVRGRLDALRAHAVFDLGCLENAARVLRRAGAFAEAAAVLDDALARSGRFAMVHALLLQERARLARALGDVHAERVALAAADETLAAAALGLRRLAAPIGEYGRPGQG